MEENWKIAKPSACCCSCQARFQPGQVCYSVLYDRNAVFERRDYCSTCFHAAPPADCFSFWRNTVPEEDFSARRKVRLDVEALLDLFKNLGGAPEPKRAAFRYVLALMLARKRVLKLEGSRRGREGGEMLLFSERQSESRHEVAQPALSETELAEVSDELGRLLGLPSPPPSATPAPDAAGASESAAAGGADG
jgi:hypothetical protein